MKTSVDKKPKSTVSINVSVPKEKVLESYDKVVSTLVESTEVPGFRKGKAPKEKVLEQTDISKVYGEVVNDLLQTYYPQAVKETKLTPISNPKVEIKEFDLQKDFEFDATVAVRPEIKIGEFRKEIKKRYEQMHEDLKKANAEKLKKGEPITADHVHLNPNIVIDSIVDTSEMELSEILIEEETDRMVSRLIDQAQQVGLSLEQYLQSTGKTADQLREEYKKTAENTLKAEFAMSEIIKNEDIKVSDEEIKETLIASGVQNPEERMQNNWDVWYIQSVLQKNKLIHNLIAEVEGENAKHQH